MELSGVSAAQVSAVLRDRWGGGFGRFMTRRGGVDLSGFS